MSIQAVVLSCLVEQYTLMVLTKEKRGKGKEKDSRKERIQKILDEWGSKFIGRRIN